MSETTSPDLPGIPDAFHRPDVDPTEAVATVMDLDQMLASATRPIGTAEFCWDGSLLAHWDEAVQDLAKYVDDDGQPIDEDTSIGEGSSAHAAAARVRQIEQQMGERMFRVRFQAMSKDEWGPFCRRPDHIDKNDQFTDEFNIQLIAKCSVDPAISVAKAREMATKLHPAAFDALRNKAFSLNRFEGVAVPKSSSSSALLRQQESSLT